MGSPTCLTDPAALLIADTSAVINLNATGCARLILGALPNRVAVVDVVPAELENGRPRGRRDAELLNELISNSLVTLVTLDDLAALHFEQMVVGPAAMTLDDGEAATIAYAAARGCVPIIDERKATRICGEKFPALRTACTVDVLAHPAVLSGLGKDAQAEAVFNALQFGRMRVSPHHIEWVIGLIGTDRVTLCASLPSSIRRNAGKRATNA
jgi:predicted nucleic acid-binding protein